jgi:hypothetical protein
MNTAARFRCGLITLLLFLLTLSPVLAGSPYWMNFYGKVFQDDQPLAEACIKVYAGGVLCGDDTSRADGTYGLMACSGDDPTTPEKDGASPGDMVNFYVNGRFAGMATWVSHGAKRQVDLRVRTEKDCNDGHEPNDDITQATEVTGPERHLFTKQGDVDWTKFRARADWVYQIRAGAGVFVTDPYLRLFDASGTQLAENDNYWGKDAEIWWWNSGSDRMVYVEASEANGKDGCGFFYRLEVVPWSPDEFRLRFGK